MDVKLTNGNIYRQLFEVQKELSTLPKNRTAHKYKYTDLDTVVQVIKPIMQKNNIAFVQSIGTAADGGIVLTTRIFNTESEFIEDSVMVPTITDKYLNSAQTLGMSITYMRRYSLCAMLGVTSDEDVDANTDAVKSSEELKGGNSTDAEKKEISDLLNSRYSNGHPIFSAEEKMTYASYRKNKYTAQELIDFISAAKENRLKSEGSANG